MMKYIVGSAVALAIATCTPAVAAPPANCASKFVGTWSYAGGVTVVSPNGLAYPKCPMCVSVQTWTCQGNTFLFSNSGPPGQFSGTLIDPNHVQGPSWVATRVGGPRPATRAPNEAPKSTPSVANVEEPGLIEGRRFNLVQGPVGRILTAVDIALAKYNYDQLAQFKRELDEVVEQHAKRQALKQRLAASLENIQRLAADQQWGKIERSLPTYRAIKA